MSRNLRVIVFDGEEQLYEVTGQAALVVLGKRGPKVTSTIVGQGMDIVQALVVGTLKCLERVSEETGEGSLRKYVRLFCKLLRHGGRPGAISRSLREVYAKQERRDRDVAGD